jgi:integrase/recombinase XerD
MDNARNKHLTIKYLTENELHRLMSSLTSNRDRALFLIAYRHGLRASEVGLLKVDDIDFRRMRLTFERLKGSYGGAHPLQLDELKALKAYLRTRQSDSPFLFVSRNNQPISRKTLEWLMKRYGSRANLPEDRRHFHVLKHSIAVHLLVADTNLRLVQDWLGHSNIQNTRIYEDLASSWRGAHTTGKSLLKVLHT